MSHDGKVTAVAFSSDGHYVVSGSDDGTARVWEAASGREVARMSHDGKVTAVVFSPDGKYIVDVVGSSVRVWEVVSKQRVARMTHDGEVTAVTFSPDGRSVVSGSADNTVRVWEATSGREVTRMTHDGEVTAVAFSPDGHYVASGSDDSTARVWEAGSGREVAHMIHNGELAAVAFSHNGRFVVSGGCDEKDTVNGLCIKSTVRVWEVANGREVARMTHDSWVSAVAFSPDDAFVISGGCYFSDRPLICITSTTRIWEVSSRREVTRITLDNLVKVVAFSPDGHYAVSGSNYGTVWQWWWRPEDLIVEACRRLPRNLTPKEWRLYAGANIPYHTTCTAKP